jgi:hypothetical protein
MAMNKLFTQRAINNLKSNHEAIFLVIKNNPKNTSWLNQFINFKTDLFDSEIDFSSVKFIVSNEKSKDVENGLMLYDLFHSLDLTTLTDERFWVTLLFNNGYQYMINRWGIEASTIIRYHWFYYTNQRRSIAYHGLARLFWRVKVSIDIENKNDPFHLTRFAFNKQEILKNSMFRNFMYHDATRLGYLDAMYQLSKEKEISVQDIYLATKMMTKLASASLLDMFDRNQIKNLLLDEIQAN